MRKTVSVAAIVVAIALLSGASGVPSPVVQAKPDIMAAQQQRSTYAASSRSLERLDCMVERCARPTPPAKPVVTPAATLPANHGCASLVKLVWAGPCPPKPTKAQVQAMVWEALGTMGWGNQTEFNCLDAILDEEDKTWDVYAVNPSSLAYGLPQALPGKKMASAGSDWGWNARTQLRWMMGYIKTRKQYGTPCAAWAFWQGNGWY